MLVLSDTHIPHRAKQLPQEVISQAQSADAVIHAGDFTGPETLGFFKGLPGQFFGVRGNMDGPEVSSALKDKMVFQLEGVRFGLAHGHGAPRGLVEKILPWFASDNIDVLIFGHSHKAVLERRDGLLLVNPGSPTDTFFARKRSYALLRVEDGRVEGELHYL